MGWHKYITFIFSGIQKKIKRICIEDYKTRVMSEIAENTGKKQRGKPFVKGQSGNPAGKPKGTYSLVTLLKQQLELIKKGDKKTYGEIIIDKILEKAVDEGNEQIIKMILNYVDGMPVQRNEIQGNIYNIVSSYKVKGEDKNSGGH